MGDGLNILVTGGHGFIGAYVVNYFKQKHNVDTIDSLTYASDTNRLKYGVHTFTYDITRPLRLNKQYDYILHLAAETHVDKSIEDPLKFIKTNIIGTYNMLEFARQHPPKRFLYFSTDEVFGPAPDGVLYKEWDRYNSGNPYSATKAGGEELCLAYKNTHKLPITITHTMNVFGESQHPEKFIPSTVKKILNGETVIIHGDKTRTKPGSRFYIHARQVAEAVEFVLKQDCDKYNIVGEREVDNLTLAKMIADILGKDLKYEIVDFHSSRPGHDLRYALDGSKLKNLGWEPTDSFEESLRKTVEHVSQIS